MMTDEGSARRENFQAIYFKPWRHWQLNNRVQGKVNRGPEKVRGLVSVLNQYISLCTCPKPLSCTGGFGFSVVTHRAWGEGYSRR